MTFRDFAAAVMRNDAAGAAAALGELLDLRDDEAAAATAHFQTKMAAGPDFMMQAMGLRTAVQSGLDEAVRRLLADCFGLEGAALERATARAKQPG